MTERVAYELAIIGGQLSNDASVAERECERLTCAANNHGGKGVGPWEYHFETFAAAAAAGHELRRTGVAFDEIRIRAVDGATGKELPA